MKLPPDADTETEPAANAHNQRDVDFSDYVWMGEEMEEFDSKCIMELCEEEFIESCFEELFEEEEQFAEELEHFLASLTQEQVGSLVQQLDTVCLNDAQDDSSPKDDVLSKLNPEAEVFIPLSDAEESCPDK